MAEAGRPTTLLPVATSMSTEDEYIINQGGTTKRVVKSAAAGGGGGDPLIVSMATADNAYVFDGSGHSNWTVSVIERESVDAEWDATDTVIMHTVGLYRVTLICRLLADTAWPTGQGDWATYGAIITEAFSGLDTSRHFRECEGTNEDNAEAFAQWTDEFLVECFNVDDTFTPQMYGKKYSGSALEGAFSMIMFCSKV